MSKFINKINKPTNLLIIILDRYIVMDLGRIKKHIAKTMIEQTIKKGERGLIKKRFKLL
jgi:hypothetical protein